MNSKKEKEISSDKHNGGKSVEEFRVIPSEPQQFVLSAKLSSSLLESLTSIPPRKMTIKFGADNVSECTH